MKYIIITEYSSADLEKTVNGYLKDGYELRGGVSVCCILYQDVMGSFITQIEYHQAMLKK